MGKQNIDFKLRLEEKLTEMKQVDRQPNPHGH
jgi:hypothetical protein